MTATFQMPKGWVRPTTAVGVLEASLEFARLEENWAESAIFEFKENCPIDGGCHSVKACAMGIIILETFDGPAVESYLNGEETMEWDPSYMVMPRGRSTHTAMRWIPDNPKEEFGSGHYEPYDAIDTTEGMVAFYPPAAEATLFLAQAIAPREGKPKSLTTAVKVVVSFNDARANSSMENLAPRFGDPDHHKNIVKAFGRALELAKAAAQEVS